MTWEFVTAGMTRGIATSRSSIHCSSSSKRISKAYFPGFSPAPLSEQPILSMGHGPVSFGSKNYFSYSAENSELVLPHSFEITGGFFLHINRTKQRLTRSSF